jgi:hypothetical protein
VVVTSPLVVHLLHTGDNNNNNDDNNNNRHSNNEIVPGAVELIKIIIVPHRIHQRDATIVRGQVTLSASVLLQSVTSNGRVHVIDGAAL